MKMVSLIAVLTAIAVTGAAAAIIALDDGADADTAVTVSPGEVKTYTLSTNTGSPTYTLSGTAYTGGYTTLSGNTVTFTAPAYNSGGNNTYTLTITATTTAPAQSTTETYVFTVTSYTTMQLGTYVLGTLYTTSTTISGTTYPAGTLYVTFTGTSGQSGDMYDWGGGSTSPALSYYQDITYIYIDSGVETIGDFFGADGTPTGGLTTSLTSLTGLGGCADVTTIGECAFCACSSLGDYTTTNNQFHKVDWLSFGSLISVGNYAFYECGFPDVILMESGQFNGYIPTLGDYAFYQSSPSLTFQIMFGADVNSSDFGTSVFPSNRYYSGGNLTTSDLGYHVFELNTDIFTDVFSTSGHCVGNVASVSGYSNSIYGVAGRTLPNTMSGMTVSNERYYFDAITSTFSDTSTDVYDIAHHFTACSIVCTTGGTTYSTSTWTYGGNTVYVLSSTSLPSSTTTTINLYSTYSVDSETFDNASDITLKCTRGLTSLNLVVAPVLTLTVTET